MHHIFTKHCYYKEASLLARSTVHLSE